MVLRELLTLLGFKVDDADVAKYGTTVEKLKGTLSGVLGVAKVAAGALAGLVVAAGARELFTANQEYERLNAMLLTTEGSAEAASAAMDKIRALAATTPFQIGEVTQAYIKLKNLGLNPTEEAIRSYGDTASSMGKPVMDMIEAVADASTGEFERLKEFGIKASKQGEVITFTFKGVKTEVANNAAAIEAHLIKLGQDNFGGAMARQMDTVGGKLSNLQDNLFQFFVAVGDAGFRDALKELLNLLIGGVAEGGSMAATLGGALAAGVRGLTKLLVFLKENWKAVATVLGVVAAAVAAFKLAALVAGLGSLKVLLAGAVAAALPFLAVLLKVVLPIMLVVGALVALGLILQDVWVYLRGGPSLIGKFIKQWEDAPGPLGEFVRALKAVLAGVRGVLVMFGDLGAELLEGIKPELQELGAFAGEVWEGIKNMASAVLLDLMGLFSDSAGGADSLFEGIKAFAQDAFPAVLAFAKTSLKAVLVLLKGLWRGAQIGFAFLRSAGQSTFAFLTGPVANFVNAFLALVGHAWVGFKVVVLGLSDLWAWLWGGLGPVVMPVLEAVSVALAFLFAMAVEGATLTAEVVGPLLSAIWDGFTAGLDMALEGWSIFFETVFAGASQLAALLGVDLQGAANAAQAKLAELGQRATAPNAQGAAGAQAQAAANVAQAQAQVQQVQANTQVGGVVINVTNSNATPGDIANAAQQGIGAGMEASLKGAQRAVAGGVA